jgi:hypothetical protein
MLANAGHGLGKGLLDRNFNDGRHLIDTNITGTLDLLQKVHRDMRALGAGRILITRSNVGFMPGTFQAADNGSKAFLDSFSFALRAELKGELNPCRRKGIGFSARMADDLLNVECDVRVRCQPVCALARRQPSLINSYTVDVDAVGVLCRLRRSDGSSSSFSLPRHQEPIGG